MQQKLVLQTKLRQKLVLTPSLQQAIKLLPMSTLELADMLQTEITENPLLEEIPDKANDESSSSEEGSLEQTETPVSDEQGTSEDRQASDSESENDHSMDEIDYEAFFSEYLDEGYRPRTAVEIPDRPPLENTLTVGSSLSDHLNWQVMLTTNSFNPDICEAIIGNIDEQGYLQASIEEICQMGNFLCQEVENTLAFVQEFDPAGVGARDLKECLILQLLRLDLGGTEVERMVADHFDLLHHHQFHEIAKRMGLTYENIIEQCEIIRRLDPTPGSRFCADKSYYVVPDVYVVKVNGKYEIIQNEDRVPQLRISPIYRKLLEKRKTEDRTTREYVREKLRSALWLIKSVDQRQKTIYKVASSIVHKQMGFLDHGVEHMKPLVLKDVANDIGMHESTVSRVVTNKYIHTPQGVFEMKYFFHSGIASAYGGNVSSLTVKKKIQRIVEEENPKKPFSDARIADILEKDGLVLARRTIAKYREELRIPPSNERKHMYGSPFV